MGRTLEPTEPDSPLKNWHILPWPNNRPWKPEILTGGRIELTEPWFAVNSHEILGAWSGQQVLRVVSGGLVWDAVRHPGRADWDERSGPLNPNPKP